MTNTSAADRYQCRLCGGTTEHWMEARGLSYLRCPRCTTVRKEALPKRESERRRYRQHNNDPNNEGYRNYILSIAGQILLPWLKPGDVLLDFGCGPTRALERILSDTFPGLILCSYDPFFLPDDPEIFLAAKGLPGFNAIFSNEVFEHLHNPGKTLGRLASLLGSDGFLSVGTMFYPPDKTGFEKWWYKDDSTHVHFYSQRSFEIAAEIVDREIELVDKNGLVRFIARPQGLEYRL